MLIVVCVLAAIIVSMVNKRQNKPTFIFGYAVLRVETESMEPTISAKSYILVKKRDGADISVGTVITFICEDKSSAVYGNLITHRVAGVTENGYKTKGDNERSVIDPWTVSDSAVIATYKRNLPVFTFFGRLFASPIGLVFIAATFIGSCAFIYVPEIVNGLKDEDKKNAAKQAEIDRRVKEEVERLKKQDEEKGE